MFSAGMYKICYSYDLGV